MKKKWTAKTTLLLLFAVGAIFFMMYSLYSMTADEPSLAITPAKKNNQSIQVAEKEKFALLPMEQDPFFGNIKKKKRTASNTNRKKINPKETINWPSIAYNGMIESGNGNSKLYILVLNGKQQLFLKGETIQGVKLVKVTTNKVVVSFEGTTKDISL